MNVRKPWLTNSRTGVVLLVTAGALVVGGLAVFPLASIRTAAPPVASDPVETKLASIPVEGMICLSCAATIKQKVKSLPGVVDAEVHFANKVIVINYATSQTDVPMKAVSAINSLGYKAGDPTGV